MSTGIIAAYDLFNKLTEIALVYHLLCFHDVINERLSITFSLKYVSIEFFLCILFTNICLRYYLNDKQYAIHSNVTNNYR